LAVVLRGVVVRKVVTVVVAAEAATIKVAATDTAAEAATAGLAVVAADAGVPTEGAIAPTAARIADPALLIQYPTGGSPAALASFRRKGPRASRS
jgi:hypothetical protein